jgi:hypothetical protein
VDVVRADPEIKSINADEARAVVDLSRVELTILNNALNEILHGPDAIDHDGEFHARIGAWPDEARGLLGDFGSLLGRERN